MKAGLNVRVHLRSKGVVPCAWLFVTSAIKQLYFGERVG